MPKKIYNDIPNGYAICQMENCPCAQNCLHQIAYKPLTERDRFLQLINPKFCAPGEQCPHFRDATPVLFACGFKGIQEQITTKQYTAFMKTLKEKFGHNPYYERRRGDYPLTPEEQELILQTLKNVGVAEELKFDRYFESTKWS